jgi:hypothetical protein
MRYLACFRGSYAGYLLAVLVGPQAYLTAKPQQLQILATVKELAEALVSVFKFEPNRTLLITCPS